MKAKLIKLFESEEKLGVVYDPIDEVSTITHLGLTFLFGHCTSTARYIASKLGVEDCLVRGFTKEGNPTAAINEHLMDGHDFVVYKGRYLIDVWISHYRGITDAWVWDIEDKLDAVFIKSFYGDESKWVTLDNSYNAKNLYLKQ